MNQPVPETRYIPDDEIDLRELFSALWQGKWVIFSVTLLFSAVGVGYALYKPDIYQASVLVAPVHDDTSAMSRLGGQLGGLAGLAGINLGGGDASKTTIAREVLQSRAFLSRFIHRHDLTVPLMATKGWDKENQRWLIDRTVYNPDAGEWLNDDSGQSLRPTDWDLVKAFKESHLSVSENKDTGMLTISVKSQSPLAARDWAQWLVNDINEHMRNQDVSEAQARIDYLEAKLAETSNAGMQQVFYQLIESEMRTVMLARAQKEYVFETIDPAVVPQEKAEPKRALIVVLAALLGGMMSSFGVLVRAFMGKES